jgi:spermidine synthase
VIARSPTAYDAILLDVDNGPAALTAPGNANLYGEPALVRAKAALRPGGVFAVWSAGESRPFTQRLERAGFDVRTRHVHARGDKGPRHVIWLARPIERSAHPAPRTRR